MLGHLSAQRAISQQPEGYFRAKRVMLGFIKVAIAILILFALFRYHFVDLGAVKHLRYHLASCACVMLIVLVSYTVTSFRWWLLLRMQGFRLPFLSVFQANYLSTFALIFLPGGGSADAVRVVLAAKLANTDRTRSILTVFGDRVLALTSLSLWAAAATAVTWSRMPGLFQPLALIVLAMPIVLLSVGAAVWLGLPRLRTLRARGGGNRIVSRIRSIGYSMIEFAVIARSHPRAVGLAAAASLAATGLTMLCFIIISGIYSFPGLYARDCLFAAPVAMVVNTLPVTPGGLGVGELAFQRLCSGLVGQSAPYGTIYLTYRVLAMGVAAYGLVPLLNLRRFLVAESTR